MSYANLTPAEISAEASKAAKRLLVAVEALQRVTWPIDLPTYKDKAK